MSDRKYYVICDCNCKFEGMTKEQILTAIEQIMTTGEIGDVDTGFITTIKEQNAQTGFKWWVGTQAEYNAITEKDAACLYIITNDTAKKDIENAIQILRSEVNAIYEGKTVLEKAKTAETVGGYYRSTTALGYSESAGITIVEYLKEMENNSIMTFNFPIKSDETHYNVGNLHILRRHNGLYASLISFGELQIKYTYFNYDVSAQKWKVSKIAKVDMTEVTV